MKLGAAITFLTLIVGLDMFLASSDVAGQSAQAMPVLYKVNDRYLVGGDGGWDYLSVDGAARRLYVSHGSQVDVLNVDSGELVGHISGTVGVHGVALASDLKRGFTSNSGNESVTIFDTNSLKKIKTVSLNREPDFIVYDSFSRRVFPMSEKTLVIDTDGDKAGEIDLSGTPEAAASDGQGVLYVNVASKNEVAVIDTKSLTVTKHYPLQNCTNPHTISYDGLTQRLFVGCRNGAFAALDAKTGKTVGLSVMCAWVDSSAWDPVNKLVFESCGEGVVSVIRQYSPDTYYLVSTVLTEVGAKTMALDSKTRKLFLPSATFETVPDPDRPGTFRRSIKKDSFHILVVSP